MLHTFDTTQKFAERRAQRERMIQEMERRASLNPEDTEMMDVNSNLNRMQPPGSNRFSNLSTARNLLEDDPLTGISTKAPTPPVTGFREYNAAMWTSIRSMSFKSNGSKQSWNQKSLKDINLQEGVRKMDQELNPDHVGLFGNMPSIPLPSAFCQTRASYETNKRRRNVLLGAMVVAVVCAVVVITMLVVSPSSDGKPAPVVGSDHGTQDDLEAGDADVPMGGETETIPEILHRTSSVLVHYGLLDVIDLDDTKTAQRQTLEWLSGSDLAERVAAHHNSEDWTTDPVLRPFVELYALGVLYRTVGGHSWEVNTNWDSPPTTSCDLFGIECTPQKSNDGTDMDVVHHIVLKENLLEGPLPKEIGFFPSLTLLDVSDNILDGDVPETIGGLKQLEKLSLSKNMLESVPKTIESLRELRFLHLEENQLQGPMPSVRQLSKLETLTMNDNFLTGDLTEAFFPMTLKHLFLQVNQLGGDLPESLGYATSLEEIHLRNNMLKGTVPLNWSRLSNLKILDISENDLTGIIPASLLQLSRLEELKMYDNQLEGRIPEFEAQSYALKIFDVDSNQFTGDVSWSLMNLSNLEVLKMSNNAFSGEIPDTIGTLTILKELYLSGNEISGSIPVELSALSSMIVLRLDENNLTGKVPATLGDSMSNLFDFRIHRNQITGEIPESFCNTEVLVADCTEEVTCKCCTECY